MELRILLSKFQDNIFQYFCENHWWRQNQYWPGLFWSIETDLILILSDIFMIFFNNLKNTVYHFKKQCSKYWFFWYFFLEFLLQIMPKIQDSKYPIIMSLHQGQIGHINIYALVTWLILSLRIQYWPCHSSIIVNTPSLTPM